VFYSSFCFSSTWSRQINPTKEYSQRSTCQSYCRNVDSVDYLNIILRDENSFAPMTKPLPASAEYFPNHFIAESLWNWLSASGFAGKFS
jgi:hypothetical protein